MDRVFLDANVLFSAAYHLTSSLRRLWDIPNIQLCSSTYAIEEARRNLTTATQLKELTQLNRHLFVVQHVSADSSTFPAIELPDKDLPIFRGAITARATHLLTGDLTHFGQYFGQTIKGIHILPPGQYLRLRDC